MKRLFVLFAAFLIPLSLLGQDDKIFRVGVDASVDCFLSTDKSV